ncbi:MAG: plastocyanin/azurin family copper-binding protein [Gemmatimonadetes bacterium]|nr:plastocyanin/azurin family copper-binding protein [Gemmatimonadota bacterium]
MRSLAIPSALSLVLAFGAVGAGRGTGPRTHAVEIRGLAFAPAALDIAVGDTVVFTNHDLVPHTVTESDEAPDRARERFDSGSLSRGAETRFIADEPGEVTFFCAYHPSMTGVIRPR